MSVAGDATRSLLFDGSSERTRACYFIVIGRGSSSLFPLPPVGAIKIGRSPHAELRLDDESVSRSHARVVLSPEEVRISDLDSHNGTYVNGEKLAGARTLVSGDVIAVGEITLVLRWETAPKAHGALLDFVRLRQRLDEEVARALAFERSCALVAIEGLDGHAEQRALASQLRPVDVAGRDDDRRRVLVLLTDEPGDGLEAAAGLVDALARVAPRVRAGVATCPHDACDADALVCAARAALASAVAHGVALSSSSTTELALGDRKVLVADPAIARLYDLIRRLSASTLPVLIVGETGVGKENAAYAVHHWSPRAGGPFVVLNCAAIQDTLVESELFGYEKGAFSGAAAAKPGLLETAGGGTLLLDEIAELSLAAQAKLLRALEARKILRIGGLQEHEIDVRIVAATNRTLERAVETGKFRNDLFFRLSAATVVLPPLRERPREIPVLARSFLAEACKKLGRAPASVTPAAVRKLSSYDWPGNVRELKNAMEYVAVTLPTDALDAADLPAHLQDGAPRSSLGALMDPTPTPVPGTLRARRDTPPPLPPVPSGAPPPPEPPSPARAKLADELRDFERRRILEALAETRGVQTRAAELLGMPLRTFALRLKQYGITLTRRTD